MSIKSDYSCLECIYASVIVSSPGTVISDLYKSEYDGETVNMNSDLVSALSLRYSKNIQR